MQWLTEQDQDTCPPGVYAKNLRDLIKRLVEIDGSDDMDEDSAVEIVAWMGRG